MAFAGIFRRPMKIATSVAIVIMLFIAFSVHSQESPGFVVGDIRLQGIQRVSAGTVFNILPVSVGETLDMLRTRQVTRSLFASGYFDDIRIARDDDVLIINLVERPAIESIEIEGNKAIKTDSLLEGLSEQGLSEGEIFRQATLERVSLELERQYVAQG